MPKYNWHYENQTFKNPLEMSIALGRYEPNVRYLALCGKDSFYVTVRASGEKTLGIVPKTIRRIVRGRVEDEYIDTADFTPSQRRKLNDFYNTKKTNEDDRPTYFSKKRKYKDVQEFIKNGFVDIHTPSKDYYKKMFENQHNEQNYQADQIEQKEQDEEKAV